MNPTRSIFDSFAKPLSGARFRKSSLARDRDMAIKRAKAIAQREKMRKHNKREKRTNKNWGKR